MQATQTRIETTAERPVRARRVLGVIGEPMSSVGYVRFVQPFEHLRGSGFELSTLGASTPLTETPAGLEPAAQLLDDVDLLIFPQMVRSPVLADGRRVELVEGLCRQARERGIKIVYSADDSLVDLDSHNPAYDTIRSSARNLTSLMESADAFIVTTPPLQRALSRFGKPVHVLPNAIDPSRWRSRPRRSTVPRVGWTGSSSHLDDLLMLAPAIAELQRRQHFDFILQGLTDQTIPRQLEHIRRNRHRFTPSQHETAERFVELGARLESLRYRHVPFVPVADFFDLLPSLDLDIGLCPLLDSEFNRHKSALKFYEYAVTGSLSIASRVTPYEDEVSVTVANDPRAWVDAIESFLRAPQRRENEWERQYEWVLSERNIESQRADWSAALLAISEQPTVKE